MKNTMDAGKRLPALQGVTGRITVLCIYAVFMTLVAAAPTHADLIPLKDADMEEVWGSSGITMAVKNLQIFHHIDYIRYIAPGDPNVPSTDPRSCSCGYIEFQDFQMGGAGDVARFNYDFGTVTNSGLIYLDVGEIEVAPVNNWSGNDPVDSIYRGVIKREVPVWDQELAFFIRNIRFFDPVYPNATTPAPVDLGSFYMGLIEVPRFFSMYSSPIGGSGFEFQHNFQMTIDKIAYGWNTACDEISVGPFYFGEAFADLAGDDPRFPTTWKPNLASPVDFGEFQIGDLLGDISDPNPANWTYSNPAGIHVGEADFDGTGTILGAINLHIPMQGSIRFENAVFDGTDFGPGAIDGMQIHRLDLFLIP